jgi:HK97 gp10 family phage protein
MAGITIKLENVVGVQRDLKRAMEKAVQEIADTTQKAAVSSTPIKTGNARKNWTKKTTPKTFEVENKVPYIERLEQGSSKQAPRGIIGPTLDKVGKKYR